MRDRYGRARSYRPLLGRSVREPFSIFSLGTREPEFAFQISPAVTRSQSPDENSTVDREVPFPSPPFLCKRRSNSRFRPGEIPPAIRRSISSHPAFISHLHIGSFWIFFTVFYDKIRITVRRVLGRDEVGVGTGDREPADDIRF